jgi:CRISPR-associated exonuclease Cas4
VPTLVSPGEPPESGVWHRQTVRAVGLAKALAWERSREIPRVLVEYPAHAVVRGVRRRPARRRSTARRSGAPGPSTAPRSGSGTRASASCLTTARSVG